MLPALQHDWKQHAHVRFCIRRALCWAAKDAQVPLDFQPDVCAEPIQWETSGQTSNLPSAFQKLTNSGIPKRSIRYSAHRCTVPSTSRVTHLHSLQGAVEAGTNWLPVSKRVGTRCMEICCHELSPSVTPLCRQTLSECGRGLPLGPISEWACFPQAAPH